MTSLGILLLTLVPVSDPVPAPVPAAGGIEPVIRLWLNSSREYREGETARVQVESQHDGYLLVLNHDTDGRLRVLFPVDPRDDGFVRGGRRYEVRGRGDRESFIAGGAGDGLVYAAVAPDPWDFREFDLNGNWDYTRLYLGRGADAEAEITGLLQGMAGRRGFDYDVVPYRVWEPRGYVTTTAWYPRPYGFHDDYWCDWWYRPSLFGCGYWWPSGYRVSVGYGYW
jgi:hypothetical protein